MEIVLIGKFKDLTERKIELELLMYTTLLSNCKGTAATNASCSVTSVWCEIPVVRHRCTHEAQKNGPYIWGLKILLRFTVNIIHSQLCLFSYLFYSRHVTTKEYWCPKRASSIQYGYRRWGTHTRRTRVFPKTCAWE